MKLYLNSILFVCLSRFRWPNAMVNIQSLPLQLMHPVSITFASKPTPQGFLCLPERDWWDLWTKKDTFLHTQGHIEKTQAFTSFKVYLTMTIFFHDIFFPEATLRYSNGRAYNRSPQWKDQRQHADAGGNPIPPYRPGDINYPAPGVSEGKRWVFF